MQTEEQRAYKREWYRKNPDKARSYARKWQSRNRDKVREYVLKNREKFSLTTANWQKRNKEKVNAQRAVFRAVKSGLLIRALNCCQCGVDGKMHAHHDDYTKRLDVKWLCSSCHGLSRRKSGPR
jgi:hypothetical protein